MITRFRFALCFIILHSSFIHSALAQGTAFTYQGRLSDNAGSVNGSYDFSFQLFDAAAAGTSQSTQIVTTGVFISDGLFTVTLDFGFSPFSAGDPRWLEIKVRTNNAGAYGLIDPRLLLTAIPYAVTAGNVVSGGLAAGTYSNALTLNNAANSVSGAFTGNGANVTNVNAATLNGLTSSGIWKTNGNAGANPTNGAFLGTTDYLPLEIKVNGQRAFRIEPNTNGAPNIIAGASVNFVAAGVMGATVSGGGVENVFGFGVSYINSISSDFGTVGGGAINEIQSGAQLSTIGGGFQNMIQTNAGSSTIAGGYGNQIQSFAGQTAIGGGRGNMIQAASDSSTIAGGSDNQIQSYAGESTIGGGYQNMIQTSAGASTIAGGYGNQIQTNADVSVIGGGLNNTIETNATRSTIAGGFLNRIQANSFDSAIGGGVLNVIQTNAYSSTIAGGSDNISSGAYGTVPGGDYNLAASRAFAAGHRAKAATVGSFVWADSTEADFTSTSSNQFLVRANGGVGIGTTSPTLQLTVGGAGNYVSKAAAAIMLDNTSANGRRWEWHSLDDGRMQFVDFNASASRLLIDTNGYIGMGTGNPVSALDVESPVGVNVALRLVSGASWPLVINQAPDSLFTITNGGQARLAITPGGFVGIGTQAPAEKLHVVGNMLASGTVTATAFVGSGSGLSGLNAATLNGMPSSGFWKTNGNAGANPTNGAYLGTTDNLPLEIKVNGQRALRIEPNDTSPNVIGGFSGNVVSNGVVGAFIGGGGNSNAPNRVGAIYATVLGGVRNTATGIASTAMGNNSTASGSASIAMGLGTMASGVASTAIGNGTTAGGSASTAIGYGTTASADYSTAAGKDTMASGIGSTAIGNGTTASGDHSTAMGNFTTASGPSSAAIGEVTIASGDFSTAMGYFSEATNNGSFVWADSSSGARFASTANNQFLLRASGGVGIGTTSPTLQFTIGGAGEYTNIAAPAIMLDNTSAGGRRWEWHSLDDGRMQFVDFDAKASRLLIDTNGNVGIGNTVPTNKLMVVNARCDGSSWINASDRNLKQGFAVVNPQEILAKVAALPIQSWSYKAQPEQKHVGPVAQDFREAFALGQDDTSISTVDADGVALAAIQGLNQKLDEKDSRIRELENRLEKLEHLLNRTSNDGHE